MIESIAEKNESAKPVTSHSRLGVAVGDQHWLIDLSEAGEILPLPESVTPVPATQSWFQGVANLRGALFGIVDFSLFQGGEPTVTGKEARVLAFSDALGVNAAILVTRIMGLQHMDAMTQDQSVAGNGWAGLPWVDRAGVIWRELSLANLAHEEQFLSVNR